MTNQKKRPKPWELRQERKRNKSKIFPRKKYLICTEGKTESIYFSKYNSSTGPDIICIDKSDNKLNLVNGVILERNVRVNNGELDLEIDEVWVVLDRDANPAIKNDKHNFNSALALAKKENIQVAYSNDAFELWVLLHYQDVSNSLHRREIKKRIKGHRGKKYEKKDGDLNELYKEIRPRRSKAVSRSKRLLASAKQPPEKANPSTTVHLLVEKLMNEPGFREE